MNMSGFFKPVYKKLNSEKNRKSFLINFFSYTALFALFPFGIQGIIDEQWIFSFIVFSYFAITLINIIYFKHTKHLNFSIHIVLFLMFSLELVLFSFLGVGTAGLFWYYIFPPIAITLLSNKHGTIYSVVLILITVIFYIFDFDFIKNEYSKEIMIRFVFTYIIVGFLINLFEFSRKKTHEKYSQALNKITKKNIELAATEKKLQQQNEKLKIINDEYVELNAEFKKQNNIIQEAKTKIEESEKKYKNLVNIQGEGFSIVNLDEKFIFSNPASDNIFGVSQNGLVGKNLKEFLDKEQFKIIQTQTNKRKEGKVTNYELEITRPDKKKRNILVTVSPRFNKNNEVTEAMAVFRDITEMKIAQNDLKLAKLEAEKANRLKSEFLANMSHEIRTPMNAIIGFSTILKNRLKNDKYRSFIDKIAKNGNNLLELINDILDLSKIEAGQIQIHKEAANPYDVFNEIPLVFSEISKSKQVPVNLDIDKNLPKSLIIDITRIRQVLLNLVSNALKFTEKGSVFIMVTTSQTFEGSKTTKVLNLIIKVKDTGIGIPENQLDAIFDSFRQIKGQSTRKYGGTGLGLAITKRLVELMDGTITVESTVGQGSTFKIVLKDVKISIKIKSGV